MKTSQKGFIPILLIVIVIIAAIAIGGGSYAYSHAGNKTSEAPANTQTSTTVHNSPNSKDTTKCSTEQTKENKDRCYKYAAIAVGNKLLCKYIATDFVKGECYSSIAFNLKDSSVCKTIPNEDQKKSCIVALSNTSKNKNTVTNPGYSHPEICNPGTIEKQQQNVQDSCNEEIAIDNSNATFCASIKDSTVKDRCYWHLHDCSKVVGQQYLSICAQSK